MPQGSNSGPILFFLYINDLPEVSKFDIKLFADDTVLLMRDKNLQKLNETVSKEIEKINTWLLTNKLTIHFSKTDYLLFSPKANEQINFSVSIQGNQIKKTQVARYLGIFIDNKLKWEYHVQHICKKTAQYCGLFCKLRHFIRRKTLLVLYHSFIYPRLLYVIINWGSADNSTLHPLQTLQNKIVRIICNVKQKDHITNNSLYKEQEILKIKDIYQLEMAKFMFLYLSRKLPTVFNFYITSVNTVHTHNTRNASRNNFYINSINSNTAKKALPFSGSQVWSQIPIAWKKFSCFKFKKYVKHHLILSYE